ncbi:Phosphoribosylaminoimidazole carboxylase [Punctularia strigosozonata HHB-11173 SS5]|uniref:Phosphoribosylaminoimidazole carboxylase n=1 Tax=Punctularia strigosozonata (strain HHB-11173) TaxID=741275 RepID=UPI0004417EE9|nr:Phosphoribosylaminoimidazole carboxylase [Punctularia strigosozonata HHB-11173 SS5]EIN14410.1 Phosphoribosylaminoimidazole carboxylase [Punctularia strigosozonata HHB-11173 SS5]
MLAAEASLLTVPIVILDKGDAAPAKQVVSSSEHIDGAFTDPEKIKQLAGKVDVLTVEIEHVGVDVLEEIHNAGKVQVHPSPTTIRTIQDKFRQKEHLLKHGCSIGEFCAIESSVEGIKSVAERFGLPLMIKSRTLAYDGRGNYVLKDPSAAEQALSFLSDRPLYAEKWMPFDKEIAVMVVRSVSGEVISYPAVETVHKENICHLVFAPLRVRDASVATRARNVAEAAVRTFDGAGVFGVEMFLMHDGSICINEIAPRPHNSGHYTIEACATSQYANHLRAILDLPLGSTELIHPAISTCMLNIIGASSSFDDINSVVDAALKTPGARVHMYGKSECRKGRKMGHITLTADSDAQLRSRLRPLLLALPGTSEDEANSFCPPTPAPAHNHALPLVSIIMGSDSDLPVMIPAARILEKFDIPYELTIVSAHRTPHRMVDFARSAAARGVRVIVAGAGGAAHLPGMVAALTALPVIGVPVKGSSLDGVDSLHSIVQMPRGIPVATVAINNGMNAGLLAVRVLSAGLPQLVTAMEGYMKNMENEVTGKVEKLTEIGWQDYKVIKT